MTYNAKVRMNGPDEQVIESGGKQTIESGGIVDFESGSFFKIGGTAVTPSAAELNKLDGAGEVVASGTQAALISDPTGGTTTDAEARTAINAVIDALQAFGIVASS